MAVTRIMTVDDLAMDDDWANSHGSQADPHGLSETDEERDSINQYSESREVPQLRNNCARHRRGSRHYSHGTQGITDQIVARKNVTSHQPGDSL